MKADAVTRRHGDTESSHRVSASPSLRVGLHPSSFRSGYGGRIRTYVNEFQRLAAFPVGHSVRDWWTWHDLNVRPRPSQSRALIPLSYRSEDLAEGTGLEPASDERGSFQDYCLTKLGYPSEFL